MPETDLLDLRLSLGQQRGAQVALRAVPRPGSAFAARTAARKPFSVGGAAQPAEPARLGGLAAIGEDPAFIELLLAVVEAQARAGVPGAPATAERLKPLIAHLSGGVVGILRAQGPALGVDLVLPTRSGVASGTVIDELATLLADPGLSALMRQLYRLDGPVRATRESDRLRVDLGSGLTVLAAGAQGHLVLATEPGAGDRIAALTSRTGPVAGSSGSPPPALQAALDESRGREGFMFADALALVGPLLSATGAAREARMVQGLLSMPGVSGRQLPLWLSFGGGASLTVDLRLPIESLTTAAGLLGFFGRDG